MLKSSQICRMNLVGESGEDVNETRKQEEIVIDRGEVLEENIGTLGAIWQFWKIWELWLRTGRI